MNQALYAFEAKEIQKYILRSDKLKDMIGGSELVNNICKGFLENTLSMLCNGKYILLHQAAGGATILFDDITDADRLQSYWPLLIGRIVHDIKITQALVPVNGSIAGSMRDLRERLDIDRNLTRASLPEITPLIERYPRTGLAAVLKYGRDTKENIFVDMETGLKRRRAMEKSNLAIKLSGLEYHNENWTDEMDRLAGPKNDYLAIIHADGNSLGKMVMTVYNHLIRDGKDDVKILQGFSKAVEKTTLQAVQVAFREVLQPDFQKQNQATRCYAARPLVIGGDDLTIILRADLAFDFIKIYLEKFEEYSEIELKNCVELGQIHGLPKKISSCAGIAIVKKTYPFSRAYELADSLCHYSKTKAKSIAKGGQVASCFAFHKVTASISGRYKPLIAEELTTKDGYLMTAGPYMISTQGSGLVKYEDLKNLVECLSKFPTGSIRTLITTMYSNRIKADSDFRRIIQVAEKKLGKADSDLLVQRLIKITGSSDHPLWYKENKTPLQTPLMDAFRLKEIIAAQTGINFGKAFGGDNEKG